MNTKLKWSAAVTVVAAGGFYAYNLRSTSGHVPAALRDAVADNSALEQLKGGADNPKTKDSAPEVTPDIVTVVGDFTNRIVLFLAIYYARGSEAAQFGDFPFYCV
ncbi:MAG: hypothetical protein PHV33_05370 [Elusimicrobiales bacterium]|nr:hypothetical protein [Elusimicrobiales bacterium]